MQIAGTVGHEQHEYEADILRIRCIERNRLLHPHKGPDRFLEPLEPAVGDRDALAKTGRTEFFSGEQAVEHQAARDLMVVLEQQTNLFEHAFLARDIHVEQHVRFRQKGRDEVHGITCRKSMCRRGNAANACLAPSAYSAPRCLIGAPSCRCSRFFSLCLMMVRSSLSARPSIAAYMSVSTLSQKMSLPLTCTFASTFCCSFSTERITFTSIT